MDPGPPVYCLTWRRRLLLFLLWIGRSWRKRCCSRIHLSLFRDLSCKSRSQEYSTNHLTQKPFKQTLVDPIKGALIGLRGFGLFCSCRSWNHIQITFICTSRAQIAWTTAGPMRSTGRCMCCPGWGGTGCCRETTSETCPYSWSWTPAAARHTCMNEGVFLHIRFLVEPLPTVLTGIGPGVRVDKQVGGQSRRSLKTLSTDLTIKAAFLQKEEPKRTHITLCQRSHNNNLASRTSCCPFCLRKNFHISRKLAWGDAKTSMAVLHNKRDNEPFPTACTFQHGPTIIPLGRPAAAALFKVHSMQESGCWGLCGSLGKSL